MCCRLRPTCQCLRRLLWALLLLLLLLHVKSFGAIAWKTEPLSTEALEALQRAASWSSSCGLQRRRRPCCQMQEAAGRAALHLLAVHRLASHDVPRLREAVLSLGCRYSLNPALLRPHPVDAAAQAAGGAGGGGASSLRGDTLIAPPAPCCPSIPPVAVCDGALPRHLYADLEASFAWSREDKSFWALHRYSLPMTPYHSYAFPVSSSSGNAGPWNSVEAAAEVVREAVEARWPGALDGASMVEWWVHARLPHEVRMGPDAVLREGGGSWCRL